VIVSKVYGLILTQFIPRLSTDDSDPFIRDSMGHPADSGSYERRSLSG